jgi:hypothetical protein
MNHVDRPTFPCITFYIFIQAPGTQEEENPKKNEKKKKRKIENGVYVCTRDGTLGSIIKHDKSLAFLISPLVIQVH